jgi:hypothetical protein
LAESSLGKTYLPLELLELLPPELSPPLPPELPPLEPPPELPPLEPPLELPPLELPDEPLDVPPDALPREVPAPLVDPALVEPLSPPAAPPLPSRARSRGRLPRPSRMSGLLLPVPVPRLALLAVLVPPALASLLLVALMSEVLPGVLLMVRGPLVLLLNALPLPTSCPFPGRVVGVGILRPVGFVVGGLVNEPVIGSVGLVVGWVVPIRFPPVPELGRVVGGGLTMMLLLRAGPLERSPEVAFELLLVLPLLLFPLPLLAELFDWPLL